MSNGRPNGARLQGLWSNWAHTESLFHCPPPAAYTYGPSAAEWWRAATSGSLTAAEAATIQRGSYVDFLDLVRRRGEAAEAAAHAWFLSADVCVRRAGCDEPAREKAARDQPAADSDRTEAGDGSVDRSAGRGQSAGPADTDWPAEATDGCGGEAEPRCRRFAGRALADVMLYAVARVLGREAAADSEESDL